MSRGADRRRGDQAAISTLAEQPFEFAVSPDEWYPVARVVFPPDGDEDTLPLYVEHVRRSAGTNEDDEFSSGSGAPAETHGEDIRSRHSTDIRTSSRLSFGTYFNAFPASYWRRWTVVEKVRLVVTIKGDATVLVYRSNARGSRHRVASRRAADEALTFELDLKSFEDGGWYWFEIVSGRLDARLEGAEWQVSGPPRRPGRLSIGVTTLNRSDYCKALIDAVASAKELRDDLDKIYIVDQGNRPVEDEPGWADSAARLGSQLEVIHQPNLGGSGGFARGMYETLSTGVSAYHLLLDDDVNIEPESIVRTLAFATYCEEPTLVGGQMFDMFNRSLLHTWGEHVESWPWRFGPVNKRANDHDFSANGLRESPWLHPRADVDYNGWWMCLVPTEVIKDIGLALPFFIKWDDVEYGLRAKQAGYATVTLPGAAVWHLSWLDKDDTIDWQAYYHHRNRLLVGLLYSPYKRGGGLLKASAQSDVKHGFSMQYYAEELRLRAVRDILSGPDHLHRDLASTLPELRAVEQRFDDAQYSSDPRAFPRPAGDRPPRKGKEAVAPAPLMLLPWAAITALKQLKRPTEMSRRRPQVVVPHAKSKWWVLSQLDSAVVSKADGTGAAWYKRHPEQLRRQLAESAMLYARLLAEWETLAAAYQRDFRQLTSPDVWARTFAEDSPRSE